MSLYRAFKKKYIKHFPINKRIIEFDIGEKDWAKLDKYIADGMNDPSFDSGDVEIDWYLWSFSDKYGEGWANPPDQCSPEWGCFVMEPYALEKALRWRKKRLVTDPTQYERWNPMMYRPDELYLWAHLGRGWMCFGNTEEEWVKYALTGLQKNTNLHKYLIGEFDVRQEQIRSREG